MSTLFDDVNKKISELFRQEIEETSEEYHPRIKDLQNILLSFSNILGYQDKLIESNSKKISVLSGIITEQKVGMIRKILDELSVNVTTTMNEFNEYLKDFSNRVVPELKKDISDLWQFVQTMQDHVMKLEGKEIDIVKESKLSKDTIPVEKHKGLKLK